MNIDLVQNLRDELKKNTAARKLIERILDKTDKNGIMPKTIMLRNEDKDMIESAIRIFSPTIARLDNKDSNILRLNLGKFDTQLQNDGNPPLKEILYQATNRKPHNNNLEAKELAQKAAVILTEIIPQYKGVASEFLKEIESNLINLKGPFYELAKMDLNKMRSELEITARCISFAEINDEPIRLANFARRVTGSSKGLRAGTARYNMVADALLRYIPGLSTKIEQEYLNPSDRRRIALEELEIFRNETPIDVLCYGPMVLTIRNVNLEEVAIHYLLGQPSKLLLQHLHETKIFSLDVDKVILIENETTFNDYVDWIRIRNQNEFVICTSGQANWATIHLIKLIGEKNPDLPIFHWGDLDRFGILIYRSLIRRTNLPIKPMWMDKTTYSNYLKNGLPLDADEIRQIKHLITKDPEAPCTDLLREMLLNGRWIEQETIAENELLLPEI